MRLFTRFPGVLLFLGSSALTAAIGTASTANSQALSETETRLVQIIDSNTDGARALLERAVNINSGSLNPVGVRAVGDLFRAEFDDIGFDTEWIDGAAFHRAGHLIARHRGNGPHILMIGHLDSVFEPDSPFQQYELLTDSTAKGPGTTDMKGGDVIILESLRALKETGVLNALSITVVLIGDEEFSGRPLSLSRKALVEAAEEADVAIAFEDGDDNIDTAVIARRGYTDWTLTVTATPAHSSLIFKPDIGAGSVYEAARILNGFYQKLTGEQYLTFNPGLVLGGTSVHHNPSESRGTAFGKSNVIAESTVVAGDLRTISIEQRERAKEHMRGIVSEHLPGTTADIEFTDGYPPLAPTEGNRRLLALLDQASRDLGFGSVDAVDPGSAGAADISFTAGLVDMALDGLGLMGTGAHTVEETADLRTLPIQTKRTAVLLYRLSRSEGSE